MINSRRRRGKMVSSVKKPKRRKTYGKIAFITTPQFRESRPGDIVKFACKHLYSLCHYFDVSSTGGTYKFVEKEILDAGKTLKDLKKAGASMVEDNDGAITSDRIFKDWQKRIKDRLNPLDGGFKGMIRVIYELVEGRMDGVIHLTDWQDISAKPDSAVLSREANVYNRPIALNSETAEAFIKTWKAQIAQDPDRCPIFPKPDNVIELDIETGKSNPNILAMVAHDNKKLEMCRFAVAHANTIFNNYDCIIATGTTGTWIKRFIEVVRGKADADKVHCCYSGPEGGDLQIAYAVVKGWCRKIVFFQDPSVSHPHDPDIRLFEQAVIAEGVNVQMATNAESAKLII